MNSIALFVIVLAASTNAGVLSGLHAPAYSSYAVGAPILSAPAVRTVSYAQPIAYAQPQTIAYAQPQPIIRTIAQPTYAVPQPIIRTVAAPVVAQQLVRTVAVAQPSYAIAQPLVKSYSPIAVAQAPLYTKTIAHSGLVY